METWGGGVAGQQISTQRTLQKRGFEHSEDPKAAWRVTSAGNMHSQGASSSQKTQLSQGKGPRQVSKGQTSSRVAVLRGQQTRNLWLRLQCLLAARRQRLLERALTDYHLEALDIDKLLSGQAMGVSKWHAENLLKKKKKDVTQKDSYPFMLLNGKMNLFLMGEALLEPAVEKLSKATRESHIKELQDSGVSFGLACRAGILSAHAKDFSTSAPLELGEHHVSAWHVSLEPLAAKAECNWDLRV